jgi:Family of unknown function (DUF6152)
MKTSWLGLLVAFAACGSAPVLAHHSVSESYDTQRLVSLSGMIGKVELVNPHVTFELDATRDDGTPVKWLIEVAPPYALVRRNLDPHALLQVGGRVTVEVWLAKDGRNAANGRTLVTPDGARHDVSDSLDWRPGLPPR